MRKVIRYLVAFVLAIPAILHVLFLVAPDALEWIGLNIDHVFYADGNLDAQKLVIGIFGSALSLFIGMKLYGLMKQANW